jgi:hypothetical protein
MAQNNQPDFDTRAILTELQSIKAELRRNSNDFIRLQNSQRFALNRQTALIPPRSLRTGIPIPNCPTTVGEIEQLSAPEARRILRELEQPVPRLVAARRDAVREQYFLNN